jgi:hypothetical protein
MKGAKQYVAEDVTPRLKIHIGLFIRAILICINEVIERIGLSLCRCLIELKLKVFLTQARIDIYTVAVIKT